MNITKNIEDYISGETEIGLAEEKLNFLQTNLNRFLAETKGLHGEYTVPDFETLIKQHNAIILARGIFNLMNTNISGLKNKILHHLELLKGGKLKTFINNSFYLVSRDGQSIIMEPMPV